MLSFFFVTAFSGTTVENPPIQLSNSRVKINNIDLKTTLNDLENTLLTYKYCTKDVASKFAKKMKFATTNTIKEVVFEMNIDPHHTSSRFATRKASMLKVIKTGNNVHITGGIVSSTADVKSEVITTRCKTFLWWEWDKQIEIKWRPLTPQELDKVNSYVTNNAASYEANIRRRM